jgi:hypothetical protein
MQLPPPLEQPLPEIRKENNMLAMETAARREAGDLEDLEPRSMSSSCNSNSVCCKKPIILASKPSSWRICEPWRPSWRG